MRKIYNFINGVEILHLVGQSSCVVSETTLSPDDVLISN